MTTDTNWSSKLGFVLASAGSAIGLGNIWRLPYLVAQHGGGTFLVLYFFFCLTIGLTILLAEFLVGRRLGNLFLTNNTQANQISNQNLFRNASYLFLFISTLILSYYFVVAGWTLTYTAQSLLGNIDYNGNNSEYYTNYFVGLLNNPVALIIPTLIFVLITALINQRGVVKGIEKANLYLLPLLFVILGLMIIRVLTLDGAGRGVAYVFSFDASAITQKALFAALGQAFFSLSVGMGAMIVYGSYVKKDFNLIKSALSIVALGGGIGLFTSLLIIPAVFAFNIDPNSGPSLTFMTLPAIFSQLPLGGLIAGFFFLMMAFAALTSTVSLFETSLPFTNRLLNTTRNQSIAVFTLVLFVLTTLQALSFNLTSHIKLFGVNYFDLSGTITDLGMMIGTIGICLLLAFNLKKQDLKSELTNDGTLNFKLFEVWYVSIKYIIPVVIAAIIYNTFFA
jgi:NSS family neurotransmitter:Na+ symporter